MHLCLVELQGEARVWGGAAQLRTSYYNWTWSHKPILQLWRVTHAHVPLQYSSRHVLMCGGSKALEGNNTTSAIMCGTQGMLSLLN